MSVIAITLAPVLSVALTLTGGTSLVTLANPLPAAAGYTLTLVPAGPTVVAAVGELLRGPRGVPGAAGPVYTGGELPDMTLIFDNGLI